MFPKLHGTQVSTPAVPNGGTTVDVEARGAIADLIEVLRVSGILAQP